MEWIEVALIGTPVHPTAAERRDHWQVGKRGRRRDRERREALGPPVNVDVVAPVDVKGLSVLIKPALLYADQVTIHSPVASLLHGVTQFTDLTEPADQLAALVAVAQQAPTAIPFDVDPTAIEGLQAFLRLPPLVAQRFGRASGADAEISELLTRVEDLRQVWEREMPAVRDQVITDAGAEDLIEAIQLGVVELAPLAEVSPTDSAGAAAASAAGESEHGRLDPLFDGFLETVIRAVSDADRFPLLDADAGGLVRAMENDAVLAFTGNVASRSAEVDAATRFMAFLPYFPDLSLQEVLDLKKALSGPLTRFRSEMVSLSRQFERPIDDHFAADVADAWRERVAPALEDIRESLAEHGLLREVASIAMGDVRRMLSEAGGVWAASHANLLDLSGMLTLAAAAGVPALDTAARSVRATMAARRDVRNQGFYFLHKLDEESRRRG